MQDPLHRNLPPGSRILIAPLDWGLGHAARCIPLIRQWIKNGHAVTIAADGRPAALLRQHFPENEIIPLKGYGITYSRSLPVLASLTLQLPKFLAAIRKEHRWLDRLLKQRTFDIVVSDNRYGLWSKKTRTVLLTHQLFLQYPSWSKPAGRIADSRIRRWIGAFDECWVPDRQGEDNLSGRLSHGPHLPPNVRYIGWLSRFEGLLTAESDFEKYDRLLLLSGPEPQRSLLEKKLLQAAINSGEHTLLVQGLPDRPMEKQLDNVRIVSHLADDELLHALRFSKRIVCRSGYSTLMDLKTVGCAAELIPTKGQTEQEYLADRMRRVFGWEISD